MKRKTLIMGAAMVVIAAIVAVGTVAAFTAQGRVTNVITTGTVKITLNDETIVGSSPWGGITGVMPGKPIDRIVTVTNGGTGDAWIRAKVDTSVTPADNVQKELSSSAVIINGTDDNWIYADGYYYYKLPVHSSTKTSDLIKTVELDENVGNEYQNCTIRINITAQAVQVKNNDMVTVLTAENYSAILGWPMV